MLWLLGGWGGGVVVVMRGGGGVWPSRGSVDARLVLVLTIVGSSNGVDNRR